MPPHETPQPTSPASPVVPDLSGWTGWYALYHHGRLGGLFPTFARAEAAGQAMYDGDASIRLVARSDHNAELGIRLDDDPPRPRQAPANLVGDAAGVAGNIGTDPRQAGIASGR